MSCIEVNKYLYEFMDGELEINHYHKLQKHLKQCVPCSQIYEFEKHTRLLIKSYCKNVTAPHYLHSRIIANLDSIDQELSFSPPHTRQKPLKIIFSPHTLAIAASLLLMIAGGLFYIANNRQEDSVSIVDDAVTNHVNVLNDNLVFNEKTSVVGDVSNYLSPNINAQLRKSLNPLNIEQVRIVNNLPVSHYGTSSPCVVFNQGKNKLSLQIIRNSRFPISKLERTHFGPKEFYITNRRGFNSVIWRENDTTYCLTSDINTNDMLRFAATLSSR
ncbi:MAG: mycothiol system anti-sigma-R factor [Candidatus Kuenenia sp.]|nr:mycothiol system anti-sigma-R factor [Candidatus Kuenenia hertensis]